MDNKVTKRLSNDKNYQRPKKTFQDNLSNQEIKEKLKEYKKVSDIKFVSIGTHIRYFSVDPKTKEKQFRLGGTLNKIDPEGRFIILSNGTTSWSAQIPNTIFFQKMTEAEYKEEMKKELKKEIMTEIENPNNINNDDEINDLKKELKSLSKKIEQYKDLDKNFKDLDKNFKDLEKENNNLSKKNEQLIEQLTKIEKEIKSEKDLKKKEKNKK
jgi:hypothetical protein